MYIVKLVVLLYYRPRDFTYTETATIPKKKKQEGTSVQYRAKKEPEPVIDNLMLRVVYDMMIGTGVRRRRRWQ